MKKTTKYFKLLSIIVAIVIGLQLLLVILLHIPWVQTKVLQISVNQLSKMLDTEVSVQSIHLRPLGTTLQVQGVFIADGNNDTLLFVDNTAVNLSLLPLIHKRVEVESVSLQNFYLNAYQQEADSTFNYEFVLDALSSDSPSDSTSSSAFAISIDNIRLQQGRIHYKTLSPETSDNTISSQFNVSDIQMDSIYAELSVPLIADAKKEVQIRQLSFVEHSGFQLSNLSLGASIEKDSLSINHFQLQLPHSFFTLSEVAFGFDSKCFTVSLEPSFLFAKDVSSFWNPLTTLSDTLYLKGKLFGRLPAITLDTLQLALGQHIALQASGEIDDYTQYHQSLMSFDLQQFRINPKGVSTVMNLFSPQESIPDIIPQLGTIRMKAVAQGTLEDLDVRAEAWTRAGALHAKGVFATDSTFSRYKLQADLSTAGLRLDRLGFDPLKNLSAVSHVTFEQSDVDSLNVGVQTTVTALGYNQEVFENIHLALAYTPQQTSLIANADMPQGDFLLRWTMTQDSLTNHTLEGTLNNIKTDLFFPYEPWENPQLTMQFTGQIQEHKTQGYSGKISVDKLSIKDDTQSFSTSDIVFLASRTAQDNGYLTLTSSLADARIAGKVIPQQLYDDFSLILYRYLPQFVSSTRSRKPATNLFDFSLKTKDISSLMSMLNIPFVQGQPISLFGKVDAPAKRFTLSMNAPSFRYNQYIVQGTTFRLSTATEGLSVEGSSRFFDGTNRGEVELMATALSDTIQIQINGSNDADGLFVGGQIDSYVYFSRDKKRLLETYLMIEPSMIYVNDLRFLLTPAQVLNREGRTTISDLGFRLEGKEYLHIEGAVSDNVSDTLSIRLSQSRLKPLLTALNTTYIDGYINGKIDVIAPLGNVQILTNPLVAQDIVVYDDTLGTATLISQWDSQRQGMWIQANVSKNQHTLLQAQGLIEVADTVKTDLSLTASKIDLSPFQPIVGDMLTQMRGFLSSEISIHGAVNDPSIQGWIGVDQGLFTLDYTNVTYSISDTITLKPEGIGFENLHVVDNQGNKAIVDLNLNQQKGGDMHYTIQAKMDNFLALNTQNRTDSLYYGRVGVSGDMLIEGDASQVDVKMRVQNAGRSQFSVLIPQSETAIDYKGVVYINTPDQANTDSLEFKIPDKVKQSTSSSSPLNVKVGGVANINENIQLNIIMPQITGSTTLQVAGRGQVEFDYNDKNEIIRAVGNYELTSGTVRLDLKQLSGIVFTIQEGSKLMFRGDVMQTSFDITAYRQVRADLATLDASFANDGNMTSTRTDVQCVLGLSGNMNQMNLSYNIVLPNASDDVQQKIKALLVTEEQRVQQFVYLLFTGSFYNGTTSNVDTNIGNSVMTSVASGAISTALSSAFEKILGDKWEIGTDLSSSDGTMNSMNVSVNVSTRFLDDRLRVKTNLGYRSGSEITGSNESLVGDVSIEYQLTNYLKLTAYNKENDKYYQTGNITQGVGIVYTREASKLRSLFRLFRKRKKEPKNVTNTTQSEPSKVDTFK